MSIVLFPHRDFMMWRPMVFRLPIGLHRLVANEPMDTVVCEACDEVELIEAISRTDNQKGGALLTPPNCFSSVVAIIRLQQQPCSMQLLAQREYRGPLSMSQHSGVQTDLWPQMDVPRRNDSIKAAMLPSNLSTSKLTLPIGT